MSTSATKVRPDSLVAPLAASVSTRPDRSIAPVRKDSALLDPVAPVRLFYILLNFSLFAQSIWFYWTDIDECSAEPSPCAGTACTNLPGSYRCDCEEGFEANGNGTCTGLWLSLFLCPPGSFFYSFYSFPNWADERNGPYKKEGRNYGQQILWRNKRPSSLSSSSSFYYISGIYIVLVVRVKAARAAHCIFCGKLDPWMPRRIIKKELKKFMSCDSH